MTGKLDLLIQNYIQTYYTRSHGFKILPPRICLKYAMIYDHPEVALAALEQEIELVTDQVLNYVFTGPIKFNFSITFLSFSMMGYFCGITKIYSLTRSCRLRLRNKS